jgi:hypothetical protein
VERSISRGVCLGEFLLEVLVEDLAVEKEGKTTVVISDEVDEVVAHVINEIRAHV